MKNNAVKLEDLEIGTIYKDNRNHFFKLFYDEYSDSPRSSQSEFSENIATILTWEGDYDSPDENPDTAEEFAKKHGVDVSQEWHLNDLLSAMRKEGYYVVPVYALHHGASRYSINDFHDKWDSGVVGIAFCKREDGLIDNDDYFRKVIDREVKEYDAWLNGEIYGITLLSPKEETLDESWGYMEPEEGRAEMLRHMLYCVGVDIQDEYQPAAREVAVVLK